MLNHGCRFEAEVLRTGEVSVIIAYPEGHIDIDICITSKKSDMLAGMVKMLNRAKWHDTKKGQQKDTNEQI
jgi:hypothetical protein